MSQSDNLKNIFDGAVQEFNNTLDQKPKSVSENDIAQVVTSIRRDNPNLSSLKVSRQTNNSYVVSAYFHETNSSDEFNSTLLAYDSELDAYNEKALRELDAIQEHYNHKNLVYFDITDAELRSMCTLYRDKLEGLVSTSERLVVVLKQSLDVMHAKTKSPSLFDACNSAGLLYRDMAVATYKDIIRFIKWATQPRVWPF